jgi:hypothetical protein
MSHVQIILVDYNTNTVDFWGILSYNLYGQRGIPPPIARKGEKPK